VNERDRTAAGRYIQPHAECNVLAPFATAPLGATDVPLQLGQLTRVYARARVWVAWGTVRILAWGTVRVLAWGTVRVLHGVLSGCCMGYWHGVLSGCWHGVLAWGTVRVLAWGTGMGYCAGAGMGYCAGAAGWSGSWAITGRWGLGSDGVWLAYAARPPSRVLCSRVATTCRCTHTGIGRSLGFDGASAASAAACPTVCLSVWMSVCGRTCVCRRGLCLCVRICPQSCVYLSCV
jgi:hypothetical protein